MADVQWYFARDDKQQGPVSAAELKQLAASGRVQPTDLIWREGMEEWSPASRLKGLFPDAKAGVGAGYGIAPHAAGAPQANTPGSAGHGGAVNLGIEHEEMMSATPNAPISGIGSAHMVTLPGQAAAEHSSPQVATGQASSHAPEPTADPRAARLSTPMALMLLQAFLWGTCVLVVLVGIALFTGAFLRAKDTSESASAAVVFVTFFIAAYVLARAGEKASHLIVAYLRRKNG